MKKSGAEVMAQGAKFLPCKHKGLNRDPWHPRAQPGVMVCMCNPVAGDGAEQRRVDGQNSLALAIRANR